MEDRNFDVLVTHANCSDGTTCALLAKEYNHLNKGKDLKIIFAKYGNEEVIINDIPVGSNVLFTDFTMSLDSMNRVEELSNSLVVLDHHKTAEEVLKDKEYAIFDMDKCGTMLTHDWLYGVNSEPSKIVKYVCDRDLWKFEYEDTNAFAAGYRTYKVEDLLKMPTKVIHSDRFLNDCVEKGEHLIEAQVSKTSNIVGRTQDSDAVIFETETGKHKMWCINNSEYISETGNELAMKMRDDNLVYNMSAQYFITDKEIVFSFRGVEDADVGAIAKSFSGGGHRLAAGMSIPLTTFIKNDGFKKMLIDKKLKSSDFMD